MIGATLSLNYELQREFIREEVQKLLEMGIPEEDVYRGVGIALGILGKLHSITGQLRTYVDGENNAYFLAESYTKYGEYHMVKVGNDFRCTCEKYHRRMVENMVRVCREHCDATKGELMKSMMPVRGVCKHVVASLIIRDFYGF